MATRYVISATARRPDLGRDMYGPLRGPVAMLQPDDALFVTTPELELATAGATVAVSALSRGLRSALPGRQFTFIQDYERRGVWIYRSGSPVGNGRAVGPVKEDEVRSRPVDGDG